MPKHSEKRVLPYTAEQMFLLVSDVARYPDFLPWCKAAHILSRDEDGLVADLVVGTKLFQEKFTSRVTFERPSSIVVQYVAGPLSHLSNAWGFEPKGEKACEVSFNVDFDFRSPILSAAMAAFFDRAMAKMVEAFEKRARQLYG